MISDIDDMGDVEQNIAWNCDNNGNYYTFIVKFIHSHLYGTGVEKPHHIPHTWGTGWKEEALGIKYIVASDILLYVR
jgi:hypothetical protein